MTMATPRAAVDMGLTFTASTHTLYRFRKPTRTTMARFNSP